MGHPIADQPQTLAEWLAASRAELRNAKALADKLQTLLDSKTHQVEGLHKEVENLGAALKAANNSAGLMTTTLIDTTTTTTTRSSAPELLIEAADTIGNRATERDNADGERSMARAVQMFNVWRGPSNHRWGLTEADGWAFMVFLKLARAASSKHRRDDWVDGAAYMALACESIERELDIPF